MRDAELTITRIPVFNYGYCYANGINHYGKNIIFLKEASKNTIQSQIQNSRGKVPKSTPYIVVINMSGPRFDPDHYTDVVSERFNRRDDRSISGILFTRYFFDELGNLVVDLRFVSNPNAVISLDWMGDFLHKTISKYVFTE